MLSRKGSKRDSPRSQWRTTIGRIFGLGRKSRSERSKTASVDARLETQTSVESSFLDNILSRRPSAIARAESRFGTIRRPQPSFCRDPDRRGSNYSRSSSRGPFQYPPPHATVSLRSVVTTLSPSSEGHGNDYSQERFDGVMVAHFTVTSHSSPRHRPSSSTPGYEPERRETLTYIRPEPREPQYTTKKSPEPRSSEIPDGATGE
jgi:hypothetical protein